MRETNFIQQNKGKWQEFEAALDGEYADPDKLSDQFVQITDDLSYARTFYPNRSVRVYLNSLAQRIFFKIYKSRRSPLRRIREFWLEELPRLMYESRREFLLSFLIFVVFFGIGVLSSAMDPEFAEVILGPEYIAETERNIEEDDPMAIYKQRGQFGMSLGITANNTWVAFLTFMTGILFGVGTIAIMIKNAIMIGVFQYFFIERGLFWESFLTVWVHGTLEISAIIIAGAAGITMGKGLVFPGTYTRAQSFQRSARRGVKIMIGIVPIIIMAGIIEGYLTRHTETPDVVRGAFILLCLLFVLTYFVWYPYTKSRQPLVKPLPDAKIPPDNIQRINFTNIKSSGEIFGNIFLFYRNHFGKIATVAALTALLFSGMVVVFTIGKPAESFQFPAGLLGMFRGLPAFFDFGKVFYLPFVHLITFTILITRIFSWLQKESNPDERSNFWASYFKTMVCVAPLVLILAIKQWYTLYLFLAVLPLALTWAHAAQVENENNWTAIGRTFSLLRGNVGRAAGLVLVLFLVGMLFFFITDTILLWFYLDLVSWIIPLEEAQMTQFSVVLLTFISFLILNLILALFITGFGLLYYTLQEVREAGHLRQRIQEIGVARRIKGLEQEG